VDGCVGGGMGGWMGLRVNFINININESLPHTDTYTVKTRTDIETSHLQTQTMHIQAHAGTCRPDTFMHIQTHTQTS
jgi:hypothetical protein